MSSAATPLVPALLEPIPGAHPCGALLDIDADEDLLWLSDTIEKTTAFVGGDIDWPGILERSTRLLGTRSKDWALVCYAARALYHADGAPGLLAGLQLIRDTTEKFWKEMHPAVPAGLRKRANLLDWMTTGLADDLATRRKPADADTVREARAVLAALDQTLGGLLEAHYKGVRPLRDALNALEAAAAPPPAAAPEPAARLEEAPAAAAAPADFPPPIASAGEAERVLEKCRDGLLAACDALSTDDAAAPRAYRLRRLAAWMDVEGTPHAEDGRVALPGPEEGEAARLRDLIDGDAAGVLAEAEGRLAAFPLWLDLQHLATLALRRLGKEYAAAREEVRRETAALLRRASGMTALKFANDVALADDETRAWIDAEVSESGAGEETAAPAAPVVAAAGGRLAEIQAKAEALAAAGDVEESLLLFDEGLRGAAAGRERFLWRLAAARHCGRVNLPSLALDLLEGLEKEAAAQGLESWEPALCADVVQAALQVGRKGKKKGPPLPLVLERMPDLSQRLARLDLVAASRIQKDR